MQKSLEDHNQKHTLLLALDRFLSPADQPGFDYVALSQRIDFVKPYLEHASGVRLVREDAQDASFICDLVCWVEVPNNIPAIHITPDTGYCALYNVRFSYYGNLATLTNTCKIGVDKAVMTESKHCLEKNGFTWLGKEILDRKYDGRHKYYLEKNLTWRDRFFEYE